MIEAIVFDIGGVLAHDVWEHLLLDEKGSVTSRFGLDRKRVLETGKELWKTFAIKPEIANKHWMALEKEYWEQFIQKLAPALPGNVSTDDLVQMTDDFIRPVEGMGSLLARLQKKGVDLAICSNNNAFWYARQMDKLDLRRFFASSKAVVSFRVGAEKSSPKHEMFKAVVDALKLRPDCCVFVDDRAENIERALKFGMAGILFPNNAPFGAEYLAVLLGNMGL